MQGLQLKCQACMVKAHLFRTIFGLNAILAYRADVAIVS